ncbi:DUF1707 SHOCT-like domain-containing protein [Streptomyces sp. NPDC002324]
MTALPEDRTPPVSDEDRDTAVRRVQEAYAEGHIAHDDLDERLHRVLTVATRGELVSVLASLPEAKGAVSSTIAAASGRIRRGGGWRVPRFLKVESACAKVRLDLSRAVIEHAVIDIELRLGTGGARITVPRDAVVDIEGLRTGWKDSRYRTPRRADAVGPTIRISGAMGFGRLRIRHARRRGLIRRSRSRRAA